MQSMIPCPYHHGFFGRPLEMFDPFSLYFWDDFPLDFPTFRAPTFMPPPRPMLPEMGSLKPRTKIEYKETPEAHHFKAELPGLRKEDVTVKLEDNGKMLHVSAKCKHEKEEKKDKYHHVERGYGEFVSKFMLPPNCRPDLLKSRVDDGVLTITVPKQQSQQPQLPQPQQPHLPQHQQQLQPRSSHQQPRSSHQQPLQPRSSHQQRQQLHPRSSQQQQQQQLYPRSSHY